jgi:hypothetical protein
MSEDGTKGEIMECVDRRLKEAIRLGKMRKVSTGVYELTEEYERRLAQNNRDQSRKARAGQASASP